MKNYFLNVKFRTDSGPLPCESPVRFVPFKVVEINLLIVCPFCNNVLESPSCNCPDFKLGLENLRKGYCDDEEMSLHYNSPFETPIANIVPLEDILEIELSREEKEQIGPDFWTKANWCIDADNKIGFLVVGTSYNETLETAIFYYKNIKDTSNEHVYKGVVSMIKLIKPKICLGKYIPIVTPNIFGQELGGDYEDVHTFPHWDCVCSEFGK